MNTPPPLPMSARRVKIRKCLSIGIIIALPILGFSCHSYMSPKWSTSVSNASWMPTGASDGAFFQYGSIFPFDSPVFYYEYNISENDFRRYLSSISIIPQEIKSPQTIDRYFKPFIRYHDFESPYIAEDGNPGTFVDSAGYERASSVTVTNGLYFLERPENDDFSQHYVYDRSRKRAYIEIHTR